MLPQGVTRTPTCAATRDNKDSPVLRPGVADAAYSRDREGVSGCSQSAGNRIPAAETEATQMDRQAGKQRDRETTTERHIERWVDGQRDRQTDRYKFNVLWLCCVCPTHITVEPRYNAVVGIHNFGPRCTQGALRVLISATRELLNNSDRHPLHQAQERCRSPVCLQHSLICQYAVYGTY